MNLSLRAKLRLSESCSIDELQETCNRYYSIYQGILDMPVEESVKDIARNKIADLTAHAREEGIRLDTMTECSFEKVTPNINASVEEEMSHITMKLSNERASQLNRKIAQLPSSAKRYYLSALVVLNKKDSSLESYQEAVTKLKSASSEDPDNIVYEAMLQGIDSEIIDYNAAYSAWAQAKQAEIDRQRRISITKEVFSTIGSVLLWIGGALLAIGGFFFSCICGMCDAC